MGDNERISQAILVQRFTEIEGAPTFGKLLKLAAAKGITVEHFLN